MSYWKSAQYDIQDKKLTEERKNLRKSASERTFNKEPPQPQKSTWLNSSLSPTQKPANENALGSSRLSPRVKSDEQTYFEKSEYNRKESRKTVPTNILISNGYGKISDIPNDINNNEKKESNIMGTSIGFKTPKQTADNEEDEEEDNPYIRIKPKNVQFAISRPTNNSNQEEKSDQPNNNYIRMSDKKQLQQAFKQSNPSVSVDNNNYTHNNPKKPTFALFDSVNFSKRSGTVTQQLKLDNSPTERKGEYGFTTYSTDNKESKESQIIRQLTTGSFKKGYLWKQGKENTRWRRRWFCLKGNTLFYFENGQELKCTGKFILESDFQISLTSPEDFKRLGKRDFTFKMTGVSLKAPRYLAAETEDERNQWMMICKDSVDCIRKEFNRPSPGSDFVSIKEGWLYKQGPQRSGWDKRFFILKGTFLQYYKSIKDPLPVGLIDIGECKSIEQANDTGRQFAFILNHPNRKFFLAAENLSVKEEWLHHIKTAMGLKSSLSSNNTPSSLKVQNQNIPRELFLCKPIKEGVLYKERIASHLSSILTKKENTKPVRLVLTHNFLYYFPSASTTETKYHSVHLEDVEIDPIPSDFARIPHSFRINSLLRPLLVSAEDEVEFKRWITLVEAAKQNLEYKPESKTDTEIRNNLNIDYVVQVLSETADKEGQKFYDIRVKAFWTEWIVQRSYEDILGLYINLYDQFPQYIFPEILGETLLSQEKETSGVRQRRFSKSVSARIKSIIFPSGKYERPTDEQWDLKYFQCLIRELVRNHQICQSDPVQKFFELDDIFHAISRGEIAFVRYFLDQKKVPVSAIREKDDLTPLHFAVKINSRKIILDALITSGASPNLINKKKQTPLHIAAAFGNLEVIKILISRGAYILAKTEQGQTPLHVASTRGDIEILKFFLENGAEINAIDQEKRTPLHYAAIEQKIDALDLLLEKGAKVDGVDSEGFTPLMVAIWKNAPEAAEKLLKANSPLTIQDRHKRNCLHLAVLRKSTKLVALLLNYPVPFDTPNVSGLTPLHMAVQKGHDEIVELLLENHASTTVRIPETLQTPLHLASSLNRSAIVEQLIKSGADLECKDVQGRTPLHISTHQTATVLLQKGAKVESRDGRNQTPLHTAASNGVHGLAQLLLFHDAQVDSFDKNQQTPLHLAVMAGHEEIVALLLAAHADPNLKMPSSNGDTALHLALRKKFYNIAQYLCEHGSSLSLINNEGKPPLAFAPKQYVQQFQEAREKYSQLSQSRNMDKSQ